MSNRQFFIVILSGTVFLTHSLNGCVDKPPDYCNDIFEKSVCNHIKNVCFCRPGFVAIKEDDRIICQTLLTNLKCRIDSDCVDVRNSSCHPGAGKCACPYNTVFVPDLFACHDVCEDDGKSLQCMWHWTHYMKIYTLDQKLNTGSGTLPIEKCLRIKYNSLTFCNLCKEKKGECFAYESQDKMTLFYNQSNDLIGCACPDGRKSISNADMMHMCSGFTADIREFCDEENYFCYSKKAICSRENSFSLQNRFCMCNSNQISIYQNVLSYYECFDVIKNSALCANCEKMGGKCYDENQDGIPDGCKCPDHLSHGVADIILQYDQAICQIKHVSVDCSNNFLSVCYTPHFHSPYENLTKRFHQNQSVVGINIQQLSAELRNHCLLKVERNQEFCIQIFEPEQFSLCSIYQSHLKNKKVIYVANLQVIFNDQRSSNKDLQFPIKCITDDFSLSNSQRSSTSSSTLLSFVKIFFNFVNENGEIVQSATLNERIKLQLQIISSHQYYARAEECFMDKSSEKNISTRSTEQVKIIYKGCPKISQGFYARFQNVIPTKNKVISDEFIAFSQVQPDFIEIHCTVKVCLKMSDCKSVVCYGNSNNAREKSHLISTNQWRFVEKRTKLLLQRNNKNKNKNRIQLMTCNHLICLSLNQTLLLALLLGSLIIALISLLIIYASSKANHIKFKSRDLVNTQKQSLSFPSSPSGCASCSGSSHLKSFVSFKTIGTQNCVPIKCYPLVDFNCQNVHQHISLESQPMSSANIETFSEIYEC